MSEDKGPSRLYRANIFSRFMDYLLGERRKEILRRTILYTDSKAGHRFDKWVVGFIVMSVLIVIIESINQLPASIRQWLYYAEWLITILFTIEYLVRLYVERSPGRYALSFYGMVDLLSFLPTYLSLFFLGTQKLLVIRILRLFRIFRIFKLGHFVNEGGIVIEALKASKIKIYVFLSFILLMATLIGSLMYMVEHNYNPEFSNIPDGIYWAIVTITTVGYGDVIPVTVVGRILSTLVMILGYGVLAVPTGIVTAEISNRVLDRRNQEYLVCRNCGETKHTPPSNYCHSCGVELQKLEPIKV